MPKKMICLAPDELLRVAKAKGKATIAALSEATGVDRKTLRLVNRGQPVKDTKLQAIADNLKVPLSHFCRADGSELSHRVETKAELLLKPVTANALRELVEQTFSFDWNLNVSEVSAELEAELLKFQTMLDDWSRLVHGLGAWEGKHRELQGQIAKVRMIDAAAASLKSLSELNVKLFYGSFLHWRMHGLDNYDPPSDRGYFSSTRGIISIEKRNVTSVKLRIDQGNVPPSSFVDEPHHVRKVYVDDKLVLSRPDFEDDGIPFVRSVRT